MRYHEILEVEEADYSHTEQWLDRLVASLWNRADSDPSSVIVEANALVARLHASAIPSQVRMRAISELLALIRLLRS